MEKTIGYALGGGGAKGFTQLGALIELEKLNIKPDYLAGTSAGGMHAILLGAGYTPQEIIEFFSTTPLLKMFYPKLSRHGIVTNKGAGKIIQKMCSDKGYNNLEDLPIPVYVTATDSKTNKPVIIKTGSIEDAVCATTATIFLEHRKMPDGTLLKDGCYTKNVPFDVLDEIRKDKNIQGKHLDFCFDVIPDYQATLLPMLNSFNKKILKNDRARKAIFETTGKGYYLELPSPLSQMDYNKKALNKAVALGKQVLQQLASTIKNDMFFRLVDVKASDLTSTYTNTQSFNYDITKIQTVEEEKNM